MDENERKYKIYCIMKNYQSTDWTEKYKVILNELENIEICTECNINDLCCNIEGKKNLNQKCRYWGGQGGE